MNFRTLIVSSLRHYRAANLAVLLGVATAVSVLSGALLVGDSVRGSLRDLFISRLGQTDYLMSGPGFFREALARDLLTHPGFKTQIRDACPIIAVDGVLTNGRSGSRQSGVQVFGVGDCFWTFHGLSDGAVSVTGRDALVTQSLMDALTAVAGDDLLLRVELPSSIPAGWLHGTRDEPGRTIRLTTKGTLPAQLPEFSIRPSQSSVQAMVVPIKRLQDDLDRGGKANTILLAAQATAAPAVRAPGDADITRQLSLALAQTYQLEDLGLRLYPSSSSDSSSADMATPTLESDGILVADHVAVAASHAARSLGLEPLQVFTYLATSIRTAEREVPYSLVAALDLHRILPSATQAIDQPEPAAGPAPIVLNDWAATDLGVNIGDRIDLDYYLWLDEGRLETRTATFRFAGSVPIAGLAADPKLAPAYPGITDSPSLDDWAPPFPVDLSRVRPRDEAYWKQYRTTPKAFVPLESGRELWGSRYGNLTAVRFMAATGGAPADLVTQIDQALRQRLRVGDFGMQFIAVRAEGLAAARGATDFGEYFTYFSFFLVVSALLLAMLFFKLGIEQRVREVGLLQAVGFSRRRISRIFFVEGLLLAVAGAVLGTAGALAYGAFVMTGLRTWWVGAVGTTLLSVHVTPTALLLGAVGGIGAAAIAVASTLGSLKAASPRALLAGVLDASADPHGGGSAGKGWRRFSMAWIGLLLGGPLGLVALLAASLGRISDTAGFFAGGTGILIGVLSAFALWLRRPRAHQLGGRGWWPVSRLGFRNAAVRPGRSALCVALIAAATFVIVSVDAFRHGESNETNDPRSGTGGYALIVETLLPLVHNPDRAEGREELNLPPDAALDGVRWTRFRLKPGDDASCLNLYQPRDPRVLGAVPEFVDAARFSFTASLATTDAEQRNPWLLLNRAYPDGVIPVIADANSLQYVLHRQLGEEFTLGTTLVRLKVVAALDRSIFQGEVLMSEANFVRLFPASDGFRYFLLDPDADRLAPVTQAVETGLRDFGADAVSTSARLDEFRRVENTYLSTFQMLGGLGLLLGSLGLATVLVRNVLERRRELALLTAVGYRRLHLAVMVISENAVLLAAGLVTGTACALIAILPALASHGGTGRGTLLILLASVFVIGSAASAVATVIVLKAPLLPALKTE